MTDQNASWLESDEEFEGVGAHVNNPRYDHEVALREASMEEKDPEDAPS